MSTNAADLVVRNRGQIMPLDVEQTRAAMQTHQRQLEQIVDAADYQEFTRQDRRTGERTKHRFLKKSGWRKIAFWYSLDLEVRSEDIDRDDRGDPIRAHVVARAKHPNGRYADGDGGCSRTERGFAKAEHDIAGTATTRAMNRAISNLVGMGDVSAEELDGAPEESDEDVQRMAARIAELEEQLARPSAVETLDNAGEEEVAKALEERWPDVDAVDFLVRLEKRFGGEIPEAAGVALRAWAWKVGRPSPQGGDGPQEAGGEAPAAPTAQPTQEDKS